MSTATADTGSTTITDQPAARQLRRSAGDRMVAGVAGNDQSPAAWISGHQNRCR